MSMKAAKFRLLKSASVAFHALVMKINTELLFVIRDLLHQWCKQDTFPTANFALRRQGENKFKLENERDQNIPEKL